MSNHSNSRVKNHSAVLLYLSTTLCIAIQNLSKGVNVVSDGSPSYSDTSEDAPSAALFSKDDLKLSGDGELYVVGNYNKGIFTKDDLEITGGAIYVVSVDDGVRGKDSVTVTNGIVNIKSGADGLRASNDTDADKGWIDISGGEIYITSAQDAIQAETYINISGGTFVMESAGGSTGNTGGGAEDMGGKGNRPGEMPGGKFGGQSPSSSTSSSSPTSEISTKGIKAGTYLTISGGSFTIDTADDALHCADILTFNGGSLYIKTDDDGLHSDTELTVNGGVIEVASSYEGLEAVTVNINGGTIRVTTADDGINAADGTSSAQGGFGFGGGSSKCIINVNGGYTVVNAGGDGIDSNGSVYMKGGTLIVYGPESSGNGALDYDSTFKISGGFLLAVGSRGMAQSVTGDGQEVMAFAITMPSDTMLAICASNGDNVLAFEAPKSYSCVIFSCPELKSGASYTVYTDGSCDGKASTLR